MNEVKLIDCMEYMKTVPDKYFELAIVDPPYGIGAGGKSFINGSSKSEKKYYKDNDWDCSIPSDEYFIELFRISKNQIIWGGNYFPYIWRKPSRAFIFWDKTIHGNSYADGELAWTSFDKVARYFRENIAQTNSEGRIHPTQKSIRLYKWLLKNYAKPNDKIFDSHVGSGSSRIACYDLGFDFEGCEIDKDYWEAQEKRFKDYLSQPKLFDTNKVEYKQDELF